MSDSWPVDVPDTLWYYVHFRDQVFPQIPMMGVHFAKGFLIAFVVGALFIAYFAWHRFDSPQSNASDFHFRVLKDVKIADLGARVALRQAYLIYLSALLLLYIAMTFFGKLILQTLNEFRVVGIQVDIDSLKFDTPEWPLLLAFGLAGLAPLIAPLRSAEAWLFERAYRAVGIPVRIDETSRNLIGLLTRAGAGELLEAQRLQRDLQKKRSTMEGHIHPTWKEDRLAHDSLIRGLDVLAQLELLVEWARGRRGPWPGPEVTYALREMEQKIAIEARDLLDSVEKRIQGKIFIEEGRSARREKQIVGMMADARKLRDELAAILAIYVERDPSGVGQAAHKAAPLRDACLQELLGHADPPNLAGTGPELGVLICILCTIPIYAVFVWKGFHSPLSNAAAPDNLLVALATAGLCALVLLSIFWFPLLAAFSLRQYYYDKEKWISNAAADRSAYVEQRLAVSVVAFVISAVCLSAVAALWAFFISRDVITFYSNIVEGTIPFLLYYPSLAIVGIPLVWLTLMAADIRSRGRGAEGKPVSALGLGMLSALLVMAFLGLHAAFWYPSSCKEYSIFLTDIFASSCFAFYDGLNFIVMPLLAFLAAVIFGSPRPVLPPREIKSSQTQPAHVVSGWSVLIVSAALLWNLPTAALAQSPSRPTVKIGFPGDVEPFSYAVKDREGRTRRLYRGYIADLCYWIFDGSNYSVLEVPVTTSDRFTKLQRGEIDVLCDPVTMRFSAEDNRVEAGVFSPIVFATSISYLQRRNRSSRTPIYIGYVRNTTAKFIRKELCRSDLFGIVHPDHRFDAQRMCDEALLADDFQSIDQVLDRTDELNQLANKISRIMWRKGFADADMAPIAQRLTMAWKEAQHSWQRLRGGYAEELEKRDNLYERLEEALREQEHYLERRISKASAPEQRPLKSLQAAWKQEEIEKCVEAKSCGKQDVLRRLGYVCPDTRSMPAPKKPEEQAEMTTDSLGIGAYRFCATDSYAKLVEWFCQPRPAEKSHGMVFLGDREIILAKLETWNERHNTKCAVDSESGAGDLTYEPYAIMVAKPSPEAASRGVDLQDVQELVQRRVYEFFSFGAMARGKFDTYFRGPNKDRKMSKPLSFLFLLNAVERERLFTYPVDEQ